MTTGKNTSQPKKTKIKIWRYMSLSRFVWLLQKRSLYFARSDLLGDPFEGVYPEPMMKRFKSVTKDLFKLPGKPELRNFMVRYAYVSAGLSSKHRKTFYINCWHMNEDESLAMWKLYASHNEAICIQSTQDTLSRLLPRSAWLAPVNYIDYKTDSFDLGNAVNYVFHKRKSFEHERELRAAVFLPMDPKDIVADHVVLPIDINLLIKRVFVSPTAESNFKEIVEGLLKVYRVKASVSKSAALAAPSYLYDSDDDPWTQSG